MSERLQEALDSANECFRKLGSGEWVARTIVTHHDEYHSSVALSVGTPKEAARRMQEAAGMSNTENTTTPPPATPTPAVPATPTQPVKMTNWALRIGIIIFSIVTCLTAYSVGDQVLQGFKVGLYAPGEKVTLTHEADGGTVETVTPPVTTTTTTTTDDEDAGIITNSDPRILR